jgi:hypothetical protein
MLSFEDGRWSEFEGGYRTRFDARPLLLKLNAGREDSEVWKELWDELHHQGDVGVASYVAVPHLVRIYRERAIIDWNTYAIVGVIELARTENDNPGVPEWLKDGYFQAIDELAQMGSAQVLMATDSDTIRAMLAILAIARNLRVYGNLLLEYSEDELAEIKDLGGL